MQGLAAIWSAGATVAKRLSSAVVGLMSNRSVRPMEVKKKVRKLQRHKSFSESISKSIHQRKSTRTKKKSFPVKNTGERMARDLLKLQVPAHQMTQARLIRNQTYSEFFTDNMPDLNPTQTAPRDSQLYHALREHGSENERHFREGWTSLLGDRAEQAITSFDRVANRLLLFLDDRQSVNSLDIITKSERVLIQYKQSAEGLPDPQKTAVNQYLDFLSNICASSRAKVITSRKEILNEYSWHGTQFAIACFEKGLNPLHDFSLDSQMLLKTKLDTIENDLTIPESDLKVHCRKANEEFLSQAHLYEPKTARNAIKPSSLTPYPIDTGSEDTTYHFEFSGDYMDGHSTSSDSAGFHRAVIEHMTTALSGEVPPMPGIAVQMIKPNDSLYNELNRDPLTHPTFVIKIEDLNATSNQAISSALLETAIASDQADPKLDPSPEKLVDYQNKIHRLWQAVFKTHSESLHKKRLSGGKNEFNRHELELMINTIDHSLEQLSRQRGTKNHQAIQQLYFHKALIDHYLDSTPMPVDLNKATVNDLIQALRHISSSKG